MKAKGVMANTFIIWLKSKEYLSIYVLIKSVLFPLIIIPTKTIKVIDIKLKIIKFWTLLVFFIPFKFNAAKAIIIILDVKISPR